MIGFEITEAEFKEVSDILYRLAGINLKDGKQALVQARLSKRLRATGINSFEEYLHLVKSPSGAKELAVMIDYLTTNKTSFFRESAHFDFLEKTVLPKLDMSRVRIWSSACSSGEEPYTIAMVLREAISDIDRRDVRVLATDISRRMLGRAQQATYTADTISEVPVEIRRKYFTGMRRNGAMDYQLSDQVRRIVRLAWLNLMEPWPMKGRFNVIFCRNVLIYFDRRTRAELINRFWEMIEPGGYLFVGHSEGLSGISHKFNYEKPAVYRK
jgi:chemotaxis protein methyltransferase CheR